MLLPLDMAETGKASVFRLSGGRVEWKSSRNRNEKCLAGSYTKPFLLPLQAVEANTYLEEEVTIRRNCLIIYRNSSA